MDLGTSMLNKIGRTQKGKYCVVSPICGIYIQIHVWHYSGAIDGEEQG